MIVDNVSKDNRGFKTLLFMEEKIKNLTGIWEKNVHTSSIPKP